MGKHGLPLSRGKSKKGQHISGTLRKMRAQASSRARVERVEKFGLDCGDELAFEGGTWRPGGEYKKKLSVTNQSKRVIKLKYKLPETKFFSMEFPTVITLSPGVSIPLEVVFRPIVYEEYDDVITFTTKDGSFNVRVRARIESLRVECAERVEFGNCPVNEVLKRTFELSNTGQIPAAFAWKCQEPFRILPTAGTIRPGEKMDIQCVFLPTKASVWHNRATCSINEGKLTSTLNLSGTGKYPYLRFSEAVVDFGPILIGLPKEKRQKTVSLINMSEIYASFDVNRVESDVPSRFTVSPSNGVVPPNASLNVTITYEPFCTGSFTSDRFEFKTPGGNCPRLTCTGTAEGPSVRIYKKEKAKKRDDRDDETRDADTKVTSINFGDVRVGETRGRIVYLRNDSKLPATFQFDAEPNGFFQFERTGGIIPPELDIFVNLTICPRVAGNFYKRVYCLIENQAPLCVDLLATAFSDQKNRPAPLLQRHVDAFRRRAQLGYSKMAPDQIVQLCESSQILRQKFEEPEEIARGITRSGESLKEDITRQKEYFCRSHDPSADVVVAEHEVDFGAVSSARGSAPKTIHVKNNTGAKIVVQWNVPSLSDGEKPFSVSPAIIDVAPMQSAEFRVTFSPDRENFYYCTNLEATCFFKSQRNFRLVNDCAFAPPWNVQLLAIGHTFAQSEQFVPKYKLHFDSTIDFPTCHVHDTVFRTIKITNEGNTPCQYRFTRDSTDTFAMRPSRGLIQPNGHQLVCVSFSPKRKGRLTANVGIILNNARGQMRPIALTGIGAEPRVAPFSTRSNAEIVMRPTCIGIVSQRTLELRNASRIPLRFAWRVPASAKDLVRVEPSEGSIMGNSAQSLTWTFAPRSESITTLKVPCLVYPNDSRPMSESACAQRMRVSIVGRGTTGAVQFSPSVLDFGTVLRGTKKTLALTLTNVSDCNLRYELFIVEESVVSSLDRDQDGSIEVSEIDRAVRSGIVSTQGAFVRFKRGQKGTLSARTSQRLPVRFEPTHRGDFRYRIFWKLSNADGSLQHSPANLDLALLSCQVRGRAGYPRLAFDDIRTVGGTSSCSVLWSNFSLSSLNRELARPPEEHIDVGGNELSSFDEESKSLKTFEMTFAPRIIDSDPEVVVMRLKNTSRLPVSFNLKLPTDLKVEVEPWADEGKPTKEQTTIKRVLDRGIFQIRPRSGTLSPGGTMNIVLSYVYATTDPRLGKEHIIPVIFDINKGKKLRLLLRGQTLSPRSVRLISNAKSFSWGDVAIGGSEAVVQEIPLINNGNNAVQYVVETDVFERASRQNHGFPVVSCSPETRTGVVEPRSVAVVRFAFRPLEARDHIFKTFVRYASARPMSRAKRRDGPGDNEGEDVLDTSAARLELTLRGQGINPLLTSANVGKESGSKGKDVVASLLDPPSVQHLSVPGQAATFHRDAIDFGRLPLGSRTSQLVILRQTNASSTSSKSLTFAWCTDHPLMRSEIVSIYPMRGTMQAGESIAFRVTVDASRESLSPVLLRGEIPLRIEPVDDDGDVEDSRGRIDSLRSTRKSTTLRSRSTRMRESAAEGSRKSVTLKSTRSHTIRVAEMTRSSGQTLQKAGRDALGSHAKGKTNIFEHPALPTESEPSTLYLRLSARVDAKSAFLVGGGTLSNFHFPTHERARIRTPRTSSGGASESDIRLADQRAIVRSVAGRVVEDVLHSVLLDEETSELLSASPDRARPQYTQTTSTKEDAPESSDGYDDTFGHFPRARSNENATERQHLNDPAVADICTRVMEETFLNIFAAAANDEFRLGAVPRLYFQKSDLE